MIRIDIHDPETHKQINAAITEDRWHKNLDALTHARQLVLEKYHIKPTIATKKIIPPITFVHDSKLYITTLHQLFFLSISYQHTLATPV